MRYVGIKLKYFMNSIISNQMYDFQCSFEWKEKIIWNKSSFYSFGNK